jgi:predicted house-cleaning noncanonical NTP pyrophosphatase (MazG superfamily)
MGKLVRDFIPAIIRESGKSPVVRILSSDEFEDALREKLVEEAQEATTADHGQLLEELADIWEVVLALASVHGWEDEDIWASANAKRKERGGFRERLFLA